MNLIKKWTSLSTLWKILSIAIPSVVIIGVIILIIVLNSGLSATTMRLLRIEGTVTLQDASGNDKSIVDGMRFSSGDAISTGVQSLAQIALDDHKVVTLEENSRAEFTKSRNMMELNLTAGGVFFNVDQPLEENETFDIRTSTMTVGIRGTSGYVTVDEDGIATLILTSGNVHITGTNPNTGETKQLSVSAGQKVRVYLFNDRAVGSVDFVLEAVTENDLNDFVIARLCENTVLRRTVCATTGWDEALILERGGLDPSIMETEETVIIETEVYETEEPTNTPTPVPEESTETPTPTEAATATPTPRTNNGGNATVTPTPRPSTTATPTPRATSTPTPRPTATPTPASNSGSGSGSGSGSSNPTPTPRATATPTPRPTATPTPRSNTPTPTTAPVTPTAEPTEEPVIEPSPTEEPSDPTPTEEPSDPTPTEEPSNPTPTEDPDPTPDPSSPNGGDDGVVPNG